MSHVTFSVSRTSKFTYQFANRPEPPLDLPGLLRLPPDRLPGLPPVDHTGNPAPRFANSK